MKPFLSRRATLLPMVLALLVSSAAVSCSTEHRGVAAAHSRPADTASVEEFDGPAGARPNPSLWDYQTGGGGWGNGELQTYTSEPANSALDGSGHLVITARRQPGPGGSESWTSARLITKGRWTFSYGTLTARIRVPAGDGLWPAFWLLGENIDTVGWPRCGEIDVLEAINGATEAYVGLHGPTSTGERWKVSGSLPAPFPSGSLAEGFVDYAVRREPGLVVFTVNGTVVKRVTRADLRPGQQWVFDEPMFVVLNVAVGGNWPGPPSRSTRAEASMLVDRIEFRPSTSA